MAISMSGLVTGLDTDSLVTQLMSLERRPQTLMKQQQQAEQDRLDVFRKLNTSLQALQTSAKKIATLSQSGSVFNSKKITSSDEKIATATVDNTSTSKGSFSINITQLAQFQKTGAGNFTSPAAAGTLRFTKASDASNPIDVDIAAGASLDDVAAAINNQKTGMSAAVIGGKLLLTADESGEAFTVADKNGGSFAADLGIDSVANKIQDAQSAEIVVDGKFTITSKSNAITNAFKGVTINAVATGTSTLTLTDDPQSSVDAVKDLVSKYNDVITMLNDQTKYDAEKKTAGTLMGNSFASSLKSQLYSMVTGMVDPTSASKIARSTDVGLSVERTGLLTLDESKFKTALGKDSNQVFKVFANEDGATTTGSNGSLVKKNNFGSTTTAGDGIANRLSALVEMSTLNSSLYNPIIPSTGTRSNGALNIQISGSQDRINYYGQRIDEFEKRMTMREAALRAQFTAMEQAVQKFQSQGSYFQSQMAMMYSS